MIGIVLQWWLQLSTWIIAASFIAAVIVLTLLFVRRRALLLIYPALSGAVINMLIVTLAALLFKYQDVRLKDDWYGHIYNPSQFIVGYVDEEPLRKPRSSKMELRVKLVGNDSGFHSTRGKIILYQSIDDSIKLKYGDRIIFKKPLQEIRNPGNPGEFDYKSFAAFNNLFHQVYLNQTEFVMLEGKNCNSFQQLLIDARTSILQQLRKFIRSETETGIAEALIIGYKQDLDKNLVKAYSNTGVVHIIAISGLHLGLIYVMLVWLFSRLPVVRRSKLFRTLIILLALWLFAILTGGSASVLRSALMFSCILVGENVGKKSSTFNSLAASAFLLLVYNPYLLWDVGFQLSYLALIGILAFQKSISKALYFQWDVLRKIWQLSAVTLAAQVLTFPICAYYFHQFPNTFLITNLLAVPLSSLILFLEIFLLLLSWFAPVAIIIGTVIKELIWFMNQVILMMQELPYSTIKDIYLDLFESSMLYVTILFVAAFLYRMWRNGLLAALCMLLIISATQLVRKYKQHTRGLLIVYNAPRHRAIDYIHGNTVTYIGDTVSSQTFDFNIYPSRLLNGAIDELIPRALSEREIIINGKKIYLLDTTTRFVSVSPKTKIDLLIISKNPRINMRDIASSFLVKYIVFDASNSLWKIEKWKKECDSLLLPHHIVPENGAFIMNL
jgi:competence protein ComEC